MSKNEWYQMRSAAAAPHSTAGLTQSCWLACLPSISTAHTVVGIVQRGEDDAVRVVRELDELHAVASREDGLGDPGSAARMDQLRHIAIATEDGDWVARYVRPAETVDERQHAVVARRDAQIALLVEVDGCDDHCGVLLLLRLQQHIVSRFTDAHALVEWTPACGTKLRLAPYWRSTSSVSGVPAAAMLLEVFYCQPDPLINFHSSFDMLIRRRPIESYHLELGMPNQRRRRSYPTSTNCLVITIAQLRVL